MKSRPRGGVYASGTAKRYQANAVAPALMLAAAALLTARSARGDIPVVLDYWWLKDYAKSSCLWADDVPDLRIPCLNLDSYVNPFIGTLETQFSLNPLCHGITFVAFGGPGKTSDAAHSALAGRHWALMIDYMPNQRAQNWGLENSQDVSIHLEGAGEPNEIANDVCAALSGRGGSVVR